MIERTQATDRQLALDFLDGSETAFRVLYRRHTPRLRGLVLRLLGGATDEADDVVQESWLRACAGLAGFRWEAALSTWLCGIGVRTALEALRRGKRWSDDASLEEMPARAPAPGAGLDVERALARLPVRQRTVLVLHDVEGYTHEEIGELLGIVAGTSKSQLAHARETLRGALG
jgi:RNA polymerase sigma-70 factor (ECF subfamily)